ncbi:hypothetical protein H7J51_03900 [Mycobacterium crocinum]|uniref:PE-PGRS family protein n=1 Tax=Mycolicibacterium crocinum TaxID=388459 RepID=A0ABY3TPT0_9MYCO|nr:hypothetical protein [Mycolicibacterium crocinum]MCV7214427.1 hypothetical protein [Mycolicibacterium crocinum]ULN42687.1 hypothetical protein MI149_06160 [Mycolicibacterium crocinum]
MNAAVRPYATAGVALVGASVIAISPLAPPMPDLQAVQRSVSSVGVELSAAVNPIENWIQVFQKSAANLGAIGQQIGDSPAPILKQIVLNQMAAFEDLKTRFDANAGTVKLILDGAPGAIATARGQLESGNITGAFDTFNNQIVIPLALAGVQAVSDLTRPLVSTVNNFAKAFATLPDSVFQIILPMTFPLVSTINAAVQATQDVYDGVVAGDPAAVVNTLVNLPANLVNGFLNGSGTILGFINAPGLLTPYDPNFGFLASGPIASLIALRDVIAQAIGATAPPTAAISAAKAPAAKTVTLSTAPEADGTASSAKGATKAASESATDTTEATTEASESATGGTGSATASTKATPAVTAASVTDSATGGSNSSSSDTKAGSSTGGKAGSGKKGSTAKSARSAKAGK